MKNLAKYRKAAVAVLGALAFVASTSALHGTALLVVNAILAGATASGVYVVPNAHMEAKE